MLRSLVAITMVSGANSHKCVQQACTTHCNVTSNDCCEPNTCQFDPVFNDARCIPPSPMICGVDGRELPSVEACIDKACTTHCNVTSNNCCEPNTCQFDPVFNDARCIPPSPMICGVGAIPDSMNAFAAVAGSDSAEYQTVPTPEVGDLRKTFSKLPANDTCEVLIQVHASSVNPSDVSPATSRDNASAVVPLGSDVAGVVVATEDSCSRISVGDSVWGDIGAVAFTSEGTKTKELGAYAEYAVALESQIAVVPTGMSLQEAGSLPKVALTSYKALAWFAGAPWSDASNATVLVLGGSGGTGTTGVQLAKHFGAAKIIATCGTDNVDYCASNGADQVRGRHNSLTCFRYHMSCELDVCVGCARSSTIILRTGGPCSLTTRCTLSTTP